MFSSSVCYDAGLLGYETVVGQVVSMSKIIDLASSVSKIPRTLLCGLFDPEGEGSKIPYVGNCLHHIPEDLNL